MMELADQHHKGDAEVAVRRLHHPRKSASMGSVAKQSGPLLVGCYDPLAGCCFLHSDPN